MDQQYDIKVTVQYTFTVAAPNYRAALVEAQEYNEHWADSTVTDIVVTATNLPA